jgi:hypothetical protein
VTSSDETIARIDDQVIIPAGEETATLTIITGMGGEATLTFDAGTELREFTVKVGLPSEEMAPPVVAPPVSVSVKEVPSVGSVIMGEDSEYTLTRQLLFSPATSKIEVTVTSSDDSVAQVIGAVSIPTGEKEATFILISGETGEATLTFDAGVEMREFTVKVGLPEEGEIPPIVAPIIGLEVFEP